MDQPVVTEASGNCRILSLDGGGIKGTYAAAFLAKLEEMSGKRVVEHFDLIAGTSTGGIIALALGMGVPASEILNFYIENGPKIFPITTPSARIRRQFRQFRRAKHATEPLRKALTEVLGDRVLGHSAVRLVIPSYDGSSGDIRLFKTAHHPKFKTDYSMPAVEVALATSAAPTFLPAFVGPWGTTLVDGGVWANCPATVALIEGLTALQQPLGSIDLLSVGTTEEPLNITNRNAVGGIFHWARFAHKLFMQAQKKAALAHAKLLTGKKMVRVTEHVAPDQFKLDDPDSIQELTALGMKAAMHNEKEVSERFLSVEAAPFIPCHRPRATVVAS